MKTKMLFTLAFFTMSLMLSANNKAQCAIGEVEAAQQEIHHAITHALKDLSLKLDESMDDMVAQIYIRIKDDRTVEFYRIQCPNDQLTAMVTEHLKAQRLIAHELLIGDKYNFNIHFKYIKA